MTNLNTLLDNMNQEKNDVLYPDVLTDKMIEKFNNTSTNDIHIVDPSRRPGCKYDLLELVVRPGKPYGQWNYIAESPRQTIQIGTYPKMNLSVAQLMVDRLHAVMSDCHEYR